jgi:hypothetical protein
MADPIVEFYNQQKQRSVADVARQRLTARGADANVPVDPETERKKALSPWERALLSAAGKDSGKPDPALAFSPYADLARPGERQPLPPLTVDPSELGPYAMMGDPPPLDATTIRARAATDLAKINRTIRK